MKKIHPIKPLEIPLNHKVRVAAYARVSSNTEEQLSSLKAQKEHYERYINSNKDWEFVDVYFDEGISGTKLKNREGLNRLIDDCEKGLINLVLTKSISRFARNTVDCLKLVRKLLAYDVAVFFEKENIKTDDMDGELMLSILAELAANESKSISENEKWSIKNRFKNGTYIISYPPYGYCNNNGVMEIIPEEADVVKEIFSKTLMGFSTQSISADLNSRNIQTKRKKKWSAGTINGIIKNEKYTGDAIFQKTYTKDDFTRKHNKGEVDSYLVENHHEAIISKETYKKANEILEQRRLEKGNKAKGESANRYAMSGKIICGECKGTFKRRTHTKAKGRKYIAWCCGRHIEDKEQCSMKYVEEEAIKHAFIMMMNKLIFGRDYLLNPLKKQLAKLNSRSIDKQLEALQEKIVEKQIKLEETEKLFYGEYLDFKSYSRIKNQLLSDQERLNAQSNHLLSNDYNKKKSKMYLDKLIEFVQKSCYLAEFDDVVFSEFIENIEVINRTKVKFILKCGLALEERLD